VKEPAEKVVKDIRRATRRQFSAEEKIRIVREGLHCEESTTCDLDLVVGLGDE
jgi:transposase